MDWLNSILKRARESGQQVQPGSRERTLALARIAESEDGKVLMDWLRTFHARDFLRYRGASTLEDKAYTDGASDRAAEILNELAGARTALAYPTKEKP